MAGIGVKRKAVASITGAVAPVGNRVGNRQNVGGSGDDHNSYHVKEVIHSDIDHRWIPFRNGPVGTTGEPAAMTQARRLLGRRGGNPGGSVGRP